MTGRTPAVGDTVTRTLVDDLKRTQIVMYAGASGDFNALHTDEVYATQVAGFPTVFAHGMLVMAMSGRVVTEVLGVENLQRFGGRFTGQVWPGDTLTATLVVDSVEPDGDGQVVQVGVRTVNQADEVVFSGSAAARLCETDVLPE